MRRSAPPLHSVESTHPRREMGTQAHDVPTPGTRAPPEGLTAVAAVTGLACQPECGPCLGPGQTDPAPRHRRRDQSQCVTGPTANGDARWPANEGAGSGRNSVTFSLKAAQEGGERGGGAGLNFSPLPDGSFPSRGLGGREGIPVSP